MEFFEKNEEAIASEKNALDKKANEWGVNAPMLYPLSGSTTVRILPPWSGAGAFFREITKHRVRVGKKTEIFACPSVEANMPCAVCDLGEELTLSKDEDKLEFVKENLRPKSSYLYNVLCRSGPANRKGDCPEFGKVYVLELGVMAHHQIIEHDQDAAAGWADVANPNSGVNLVIKRTGQGRYDTKYTVTPHGAGRSDFYADCDAVGIDAGDLKLINLDEVYTVPEADKVEAVVSALKINVPSPTPVAQPVMQTVSPTAVAPMVAPMANVTTQGPLVTPVTAPSPVAAPAAQTAEVPQPPAVPSPPTE